MQLSRVAQEAKQGEERGETTGNQETQCSFSGGSIIACGSGPDQGNSQGRGLEMEFPALFLLLWCPKDECQGDASNPNNFSYCQISQNSITLEGRHDIQR